MIQMQYVLSVPSFQVLIMLFYIKSCYPQLSTMLHNETLS
jgi:hypothetical protein